jgi:hypothetical protein
MFENNWSKAELNPIPEIFVTHDRPLSMKVFD